MEEYLIEVWRSGEKIVHYLGIPDDLQTFDDLALRDWYSDLMASKRWHSFCETFDSCSFRSGILSYAKHTIRISPRKKDDNV